MENTDLYLEPLKYYESFLKNQHQENVEQYFNELTEKSGIDVASNKATCNKYYAEKNILDKFKKSLSATKAGITIMIILMVVGILAGVILLTAGTSSASMGFIIAAIVAFVIAIVALIIWLTVFRNKKKNLQDIVNKKERQVDEIQREAFNQVYDLNALFNNRMAPILMEKSAPLIDFDEYLSSKTEERIVEQFKDEIDTSIDHSSLVIQSGKINTNPFLLRQKLVMEMRPEIYTGHLIITYTRVVSDGNGGTKTITVSQTLTATVTKPKPHYSVETSLTYYNDAASKLSFYRTPAGLVGKNEKQVQRIVNKEDKENTKKAQKALKNGQNYTKFANSKFEAYINSEKRDNELEYRLLFTPLAQNNFVYSFSKHDDIYFDKHKCVNTILSTHDVNMDYSGDVSNYISFDYEVIKNNFISYNMKFFEGIYFDFVPLLNIPLYHQHQSAPYISHTKENIISYYDAEVLINKFEPDLFKPDTCDTEVILKPSLEGNSIIVTAYGFNAVARTDFVPVLGGDGIMHPVPVNYYEYLRVQDQRTVNLINKKSETLDNDDNSVINYKQYKAMLIK